MLSLIAITAALRTRGIIMCKERRQAVIDAMELGALLNDRFDGDPYDPKHLRGLINGFARSMHRDVVWSYAKRLRQLEHSRPAPADHDRMEVRLYRENVNSISLAMLWALGRARTLRIAESEIEQERDLRLLFQIVMLAQVIDDVSDFHEDQRRELPSFVTCGASPGKMIDLYADGEPMQFNRCFCLQVALRMVTVCSRLVLITSSKL
jgi:hypothetical protein